MLRAVTSLLKVKHKMFTSVPSKDIRDIKTDSHDILQVQRDARLNFGGTHTVVKSHLRITDRGIYSI